MGFRFSFTPLPGFFSPFLHSTCALSVAMEYLGLGGGPPDFIRDFKCPALLWVLLATRQFRLRDFHPLRCAFPKHFGYRFVMLNAAHNPQGITTPSLALSLFARRYLGNHCCFLLLPLLRCFSSRRFPSYGYGFTIR